MTLLYLWHRLPWCATWASSGADHHCVVDGVLWSLAAVPLPM